MFLTAEILLGIGMSLISGADSALIYDTLKISNNQNQYRKKEGKFQAIGNFSESIASVLGGFIAIYSIRATFIPYIVLSAIAVLVALSIVEPPKSKQKTTKHSNPILELYSIVKYSLKDHKEVAALIFYAGLISASTLSMVFFIQPYFLLVGLPIGLFGIVWAALNFSVGIFSLYADLYEIKFGRRFSLISLIFYSILGYLLLSVFQTLWATFFILLFYFTRGISGPILKDYVNTHIDSSIRATVLSVKNLVGRLIFTVISPFLGYFADTYSLATAFQISAIFFCITGTISLLYLKKHNAL
jgi:MFS family permease